jgi:hypothetical protein
MDGKKQYRHEICFFACAPSVNGHKAGCSARIDLKCCTLAPVNAER